MKSEIQRAINTLGSQKKLGEAIGVTQACVSKWMRSEDVELSLDTAFKIEKATAGKVKVSDLRPDYKELIA